MFNILGSLAAAAIISFSGSGHKHNVCPGFVEENNVRIPTHVQNMLVQTGISESEYNKILDRVDEVFSSRFKSRGAKLKIDRQWEDDVVNAYAERDADNWIVTFPGGLPRHPIMTGGAFALVACHEVGHHIGGFPASYYEMSIEGQADYYANSKCLRDYFTPETNKEFFANHEINPSVLENCKKSFPLENDWMSCVRGANAGMVVALLFKALREEEKSPAYDEPDPTKVDDTIYYHPDTQCRLDTYYSGSRCQQSQSVDFGADEEQTGACTVKNGHPDGYRPRCWFKPSE